EHPSTCNDRLGVAPRSEVGLPQDRQSLLGRGDTENTAIDQVDHVAAGCAAVHRPARRLRSDPGLCWWLRRCNQGQRQDHEREGEAGHGRSWMGRGNTAAYLTRAPPIATTGFDLPPAFPEP